VSLGSREPAIGSIKTPWQGDPRVNIQSAKGKGKPYQARQVLQAIRRLEEDEEEDG